MTSCDECPAAYECHILRALLAVVERHKGLFQEEALRAQYERLRVRLAVDGWSYPESDQRCGLAAQPARVRWLTQELVRMWEEREAAKRGGSSRESPRHDPCSRVDDTTEEEAS